MQGLQPQSLTDKELAHYAGLMRPQDVPPAWVEELIKRFEERVLNDRTR